MSSVVDGGRLESEHVFCSRLVLSKSLPQNVNGRNSRFPDDEGNGGRGTCTLPAPSMRLVLSNTDESREVIQH